MKALYRAGSKTPQLTYFVPNYMFLRGTFYSDTERSLNYVLTYIGIRTFTGNYCVAEFSGFGNMVLNYHERLCLYSGWRSKIAILFWVAIYLFAFMLGWFIIIIPTLERGIFSLLFCTLDRRFVFNKGHTLNIHTQFCYVN